MHPALATANPFQDISVSPGEILGSLPSGESEPWVTTAYTPGENTSDGKDVPAQMQGSSDCGPLRDGATSGDTMRGSRPAHPATAPSDRFILDEQAFLDAIEPPPLFLQPGYKFARRTS